MHLKLIFFYNNLYFLKLIMYRIFFPVIYFAQLLKGLGFGATASYKDSKFVLKVYFTFNIKTK